MIKKETPPRISYKKTITIVSLFFIFLFTFIFLFQSVGYSALSWSPSKKPLRFVGPNAMAPSDSNTIYCGTADLPIVGTHDGNGFWKTTDNGESWVQINDANLPANWWILSMAIDPATSNIVYVGPAEKGSTQTIGHGIYKSTNGGATWMQKTNGLPACPSTQCNVASIAIDENTGYIYAGTTDLSMSLSHQGIFKSTNGGDNWYAINNGISYLGISYCLTTPTSDCIYITTAGVAYPTNTEPRVYKSTDGGANWSDVSGNLIIPANKWSSGMITYFRLGEKPQNDNTIYLSAFTYVSIPDSGLYKTTNSGANWVKLKEGIFGSAYTNPLNYNSIWLAGECTDNDVHQVGVFHSNDGGSSWTAENEGLPTPNPAAAFMSIKPGGDYIFASVRKDPNANPDGTDDDGIYRGEPPEYPTGWVKINNGAEYTTSSNVTLTLYATDTRGTTPGVANMIIANDSSFTGSSWESYTTSKSWNLIDTEGLKTVYVKYRDFDGEVSPVYSDSIILDKNAPTGAISINNGAAETTNINVTLSLSANDGAGSGVQKMMISNDASFTGASWENYATSKNWNLASGYGKKTVYAKFMDNVGFVSNICSDDIIYKQTIAQPVRLCGDTRYETAIALSKEAYPTPAHLTQGTILITRGDMFPDALSGAILAFKYNAPLLLTYPSSLNETVQAEISRLKPKKIIILGAEGAVSKNVEAALIEKCGISAQSIDRIGGAGRYETAALIAQRSGKSPTGYAIIAWGENYPDALAAASFSAYKSIPILLVQQNIIPEEVKKVLKSSDITRSIIVGGSDVVPSGIKDWLDSHGYPCTRLDGDDRYGTAEAIASFAIAQGLSAENIMVCWGENFPDALVAGPFAAKYKAPIILTRENFIPDLVYQFIKAYKTEIKKVYIAGGPDIITDEIVNRIINYIKI